MISIERDLAVLAQINAILERPKESAAARIAELFTLLFEAKPPRPKVFLLSPPTAWDGPALSRALALLQSIVTQYVQIFQDPREIPVTYYARQKRTAIHLDQEFGPLLRKLVLTSGKDPLVDENGAAVADPFLDEPILYLKQEARKKGFPKSKKSGGVSLSALNERFLMKLTAKGLKAGTEGFEVAPQSRQDAARTRLARLLDAAQRSDSDPD